MKTLYLHIGSWKTGTSAIQRMLATNRERLRGRNLDYLQFSFERDAVHEVTAGNGELFARVSFRAPRSHPDPQDYLRELREVLEKSKCSKVLLSSELFFLQADPETLRSMLHETFGGTVQYEVICYLRRQDEMIERAYVENVKLGREVRPFPEASHEYIHNPDHCYLSSVERWTSAFGHEHLVVRPHEKTQFVGASLTSDFLHQVGINEVEEIDLPGAVNASLDNRGLEVVRLLKKLALSPSEHSYLMRQVSDFAKLRDDYRAPVLLGQEERRAVVDGFERENQEIARRFLGREALFLEEIRSDLVPNVRLDTEYVTELFLYLLARSNRNLNFRLAQLQQ